MICDVTGLVIIGTFYPSSGKVLGRVNSRFMLPTQMTPKLVY